MGMFSLNKLLGITPKDTKDEEKQVFADKVAADEEKKRYEALKREKKANSAARDARSSSMQGGGRKGLMYGGSSAGVA